MEIAILVIASFAAVCAAAALVICAALIRGRGGESALERETDIVVDTLHEVVCEVTQKTGEQTDNGGAKLLAALNSSNASLSAMLEPYMKRITEQTDKTSQSVDKRLDDMRLQFSAASEELRSQIKIGMGEVRGELKENVDNMRTELRTGLGDLRKENSEKLTQMRETVDEKLSRTLNERITGAFQLVNDRLDAVTKGFGEMKSLSDNVVNLNKAFSNVKTRGGWGEVALESLLEQILSPEQFVRQYKLPRRNERVDFAVVMPGRDGESVYLPIDSKFPMADYEKLVDAGEKGSVEDIAKAHKALMTCIKKQAQSISEKYIAPPVTTDFAIMYLPTEGLYAEAIKDATLAAELQTAYRITVCGPSTITALLNSLQMGFTTLKIQKRSGEIAKLLTAFKKDFATFTGLICKVKKNAEKVVSDLDEVTSRNNKIQRKLDKVVDEEEATEIERDVAREAAAELLEGDEDGQV